MKREILQQYDMGFLNCIGLILFLAIFFGALIWVYRKNSKKHYEYMSDLPLAD